MRILVIGGGGREHALVWAIAGSPLVDALFCAPGNAGISADAECVAIEPTDLPGLVAFARDHRIDLAVIGPEAPLAAGLADRLQDAGIAAFGPSAAAAQLEASKVFMKELAVRSDVATADFAVFDDPVLAKTHVRSRGAPIVVKADGLAAGKGVVVAATVAEAEAAIENMAVSRAFGAAGSRLIIEECLSGEEASAFALVDGERVLMLASARDHKRIGEGDTGANTGGMGAYSPSPLMDSTMTARVEREILEPIVRRMAEDGVPYRGALYAGLMIDGDVPRLLEFNARFGDPETQVLLPRLRSDIVPALQATATGSLAHADLRWSEDAAVCVVMAAKGYPGAYGKGDRIGGLDRVPDDVVVFHAGTAKRNGDITADGGRVLAVTGMGTDIHAARRRAYAGVEAIDWPGGVWRKDIAASAAAERRRTEYRSNA